MPDNVTLTEAQLEEWKAVRERGYVFYIATRMAIGFLGAILSLITVFVLNWLSGAEERWSIFKVISWCMMFVVITTWFGVINWRGSESLYKQHRPELKPNRYVSRSIADDPTRSPEWRLSLFRP